MTVVKVVLWNVAITMGKWRRILMLVLLNLIVLIPWMLTGSSMTSLLQGNTVMDFQSAPLVFPILWYWEIIWPVLLCQHIISEISSNILISVLLNIQKRAMYVIGQIISILIIIASIDVPILVMLSLFQMRVNWLFIFTLVGGSILTTVAWFLTSLFGSTILGFSVAILFPLINLASKVTWFPSTLMMYVRVKANDIGIVQLMIDFFIYLFLFYMLVLFRFQHMDILGKEGD